VRAKEVRRVRVEDFIVCSVVRIWIERNAG
jgi:hypothetical protein